MENTLTKEIKKYMKENQLSFTKFCKVCKTSPKTIQKMMRGNLKVKTSSAIKVADTLNLSLQYLFQEYLKNVAQIKHF